MSDLAVPTPTRCPCGSDATVKPGDEPGSFWCGCASCNTGIQATPTADYEKYGHDLRHVVIQAWNGALKTRLEGN